MWKCWWLTLCALTSAAAAHADDAVVIDDAAAAQRTFAAKMLDAASEPEKNLVLSPLSMHTVLAMVLEGAAGETATEMATALALPSPTAAPAIGHLNSTLASDGDQAGPIVATANRVWVDVREQLLPGFEQSLSEHFESAAATVDTSIADEAAATINAWIEDNTNGRIKNLLTPDVVRDAALILTNAVWFKGTWAEQFDPERTRTSPFALLDGTSVDVPIMRSTSRRLPVVFGETFQAFELAYVGETMTMLVVVPAPGQLEPMTDALAADAPDDGEMLLDQIVADLQPQEVIVGLPRFEARVKLDARAALQALGMRMVFTSDADLSKMVVNGAGRLSLGPVVHEAWIRVDEEGTEAAGATGAIVARSSIRREIIADRPFLFFVRDVSSGAILFAGRIVDPR
ncbi:MAG: serpin family protein [Planctomycetota bacterium]